MDGSMRKYGHLSPGRIKEWTEKSPKYQHQPERRSSKVPIVYYLSSNQKLEHPHFMEVPVSSSDGLQLRDVIKRLNAVRGRGMAAKYSWSFKRRYKNGYVWHDLCEEDLILPADGNNEYVLKGSELLEGSCLGGFSPAETIALRKKKQWTEPRLHHDSSSSSNVSVRTRRGSQAEYLSPIHHRSCSSAASPDSLISMKNSWNCCPLQYVDASTQTDLDAFGIGDQQPCNKDFPPMEPCNEKRVCEMNGATETSRGFISPPLLISSESFPGYQTDTLDTLIRADKLKTFETQGPHLQPATKLKPAKLIMQLISCGPIYVKDHEYDGTPYSHSLTPSMFSSPALMTREFDAQFKSPQVSISNYESKECFTESLAQTKFLKDHPSPSFSSLGGR